MNVSSFFQGSALRFGVTGEGVTIDPATGEIGITAEALRTGITVTVTAPAAGEAPEQSFKFRIAGEAEDFAPVILTPPALNGSGLIGAPLVVEPGAWGGQPTPEIALQWLRGGAEIAGATAATYVPQAADDAAEITCRVTASNAAGVLSAEPAPVRITRAAPTVVDMLADVSVVKGAAAVTVSTAPAFAGEGLSFAVTGGSAAIDAATGVVTLPTDVLRDGETVVVTAANSGGAVEASFLVTVRLAEPLPVAPGLLAAPVLAGSAKIGSEVRVETGIWSGLPLPTLTLQWLRDGAAIEGATSAVYLPRPADDRCAIACRVTGRNTAGSHAVETASLGVTHVAPSRTGELFDEVFDQAPGAETVATAQVFTGESLAFAVTGGGASIDAGTGVVTIPTETVRSGETVAVTATNSGGSAQASFLLTIEGLGFPPLLADSAWSAREVRDVAPAGRRQVTIAAGAVAAGYELCLYSGLADGRENTDWRKVLQPGATYTTGSSMAVGSSCLNLLFWRRVADGAWAVASNEVVIPIKGLEAVEVVTPGTSGANQVLAAANQATLKAALDARIASKATGDWIIDLPNGSYGLLNLDGRQLPGKTVLRAQNQNLGARFSGIEMSGCRNITLQFVDVDRTTGGAGNLGVRMSPAQDCGIEYSRIHVGGIVLNSGKPGWAMNVTFAIEMGNVGEARPERCRVHMNQISGPCGKGIYLNGAFDCVISDNVFENAGGDCIHMGWGGRNSFIRNWGARAYYPDYDVNSGWDHSDFIQVNSQAINVENLIYRGNVHMGGVGGANYLPWQGQFSSRTKGTGWDFEDNIICANSYHGITTGDQFSGVRARKNTVLRMIDMPGDQHTVQFNLQGAVEAQYNVQCGFNGNTSMGSNGLNIVMTNTSHTASLAYYTAPYMASSFYEMRPVAGAVTHWDYAKGTPVGAYARFRDVILNGAYPKIGPAAAAWKTWYDPKNEIRS